MATPRITVDTATNTIIVDGRKIDLFARGV